MKHIKPLDLFEASTNSTCPHCDGTGFILSDVYSRQVAKILKSVKNLQTSGNGDKFSFPDNVEEVLNMLLSSGDQKYIDLVKRHFMDEGVFSKESLEIVKGLNLSKKEMEELIDVTEGTLESIKYLHAKSKDLDSRTLDKLETAMKEIPGVIASLKRML